MSENQLRKSIRLGTFVSIGSQFGSQIVSLVILAGLYKWVPRADFGLIAAAQLLVMLPRTVVLLGLNAAGIQKETLDPAQLRGLFWWNIGLGAVASALTALLVPWVAYWKGSLELPAVGYSLAASSLVASLGIAHQTLLERELRLPVLQGLRLLAQVIAGLLAWVVAWKGGGVWALVVQNYVELGLLVIGCWMAAPFWPGRPGNAWAARPLLRFGGKYALVSLLFYLSANLDKLLLYALLPTTESGLSVFGMYQQAYNWMMRPVLAVSTPITAVMLPALSRVQRDHIAFERLSAGFFRVVGLVLLPSAVGLFLVAEDAMVALGGLEWQPAGGLLRALAPIVLVQGLINICGSVFSAAARMNAFLFGAVCLMVVQAQGLAAGYFFVSRVDFEPLTVATGIAWAFSLTMVAVLALPYLGFCCRATGMHMLTILAPLRMPLLGSLAMGIVVWSVRGGLPADSAWTRLLVSIAIGSVSYAWILRRELRSVWQEFGAIR